MLIRTVFVVLSTHALIVLLVGVVAPTAPTTLNAMAPAMTKTIGLRKRVIERGIERMCALSMSGPVSWNESRR